MTHYEAKRHQVTLGALTIGESPTKKTPGIFIDFTPQNGPYVRQVRLWLTDKTVDRTIAILRSLGWTGDRFSELRREQFNGIQCELDCAHGESGFEEWDFPPPPKADREPADPGIARKLDALFGKELAKTASKETETVPPPPVPEDDDIPF